MLWRRSRPTIWGNIGRIPGRGEERPIVCAHAVERFEPGHKEETEIKTHIHPLYVAFPANCHRLSAKGIYQKGKSYPSSPQYLSRAETWGPSSPVRVKSPQVTSNTTTVAPAYAFDGSGLPGCATFYRQSPSAFQWSDWKCDARKTVDFISAATVLN